MNNRPPFIDYKERKDGTQYDFSLMFMQAEQIEIIYDLLLREKDYLLGVIKSRENEENEVTRIVHKKYMSICQLIEIIKNR